MLLDILKNDKALVIVSVTVIAVLVIFKIPDEAGNILNMILAGIFGLATGAAMRSSTRTTDQSVPNGVKPEVKP